MTQKPGVPIVIGGKAGRIYQRVARHGDGWCVPPCDADELATMLGKLRRACDDEGRDIDAIEITVLWDPEAGEDSLEALTRTGVSRVITMPGGLPDIKTISDRYIV
jgi:alkanesulfonate monooxygenase SsuD/methylene tetrahydromethanopterin reductase-like flavin-dependent oxidoreductase (luciferase family)